MRIIQFITIVSLTVFFSFSCDSSAGTNTIKGVKITQETEVVKDIDVKMFRNLISPETIILDVRTKGEFDSGHLKDAVNINFFEDDFMDQVMKLDKSKTLLIHCASGGRSAKAMKKLKGSGFNTLYNMLGGFSAWQSAGFEVIK